MDSSTLAKEILADGWEYGRLVLIAGIASAVWGVLLSRWGEEGDRSSFQFGLIRIVLVVTGGFCLFSFLNAQLENIIVLGRVEPAWGIFTALVAVSFGVCVAVAVYRTLDAERTASVLSLLDAVQEHKLSPARKFMLVLSIPALLAVVSIFWLWRIAN